MIRVRPGSGTHESEQIDYVGCSQWPPVAISTLNIFYALSICCGLRINNNIMEQSSSIDNADEVAAAGIAQQQPAAPSETQVSSSTTTTIKEGEQPPPLSKNQLKKRRRWEKCQAIKKRRKEQEREIKRLKAQKEGRDLDAERAQQLQNQESGKGWAKREAKWKEIIQKANIDNSFRVCFDCVFEDQMTAKEINSLSLQLRYTYSVNRKSTMPVYIDVCGLKRDGLTYQGLEKVEGFPDSWVGRAFQCYENGMEEVYSNAVVDNDTDKNSNNKVEGKSDGGELKEDADADTTAAAMDDDKDTARKQPPHPKLPPNHKFVYLTGDSPNTLSTLDNNTTYIIGGIVDRNRLKRAAIDRSETINKQYPMINISTARLPFDDLDFKASTRILTCNHVFEILQKYREKNYTDWRGSIMSVLPCRKDVEEKTNDDGGGGGNKDEATEE